MKSNKGFTLIELMIVIAIIAILMAYALPAYRDYQVRSKRGECNAMTNGLKTTVALYQYDNTVWPANLGVLNIAATNGEYVSSLTVTGNGVVNCNMRADAGAGTVSWTPSIPAGTGSILWSCSDTVTATNPNQDACP